MGKKNVTYRLHEETDKMVKDLKNLDDWKYTSYSQVLEHLVREEFKRNEQRLAEKKAIDSLNGKTIHIAKSNKS